MVKTFIYYCPTCQKLKHQPQWRSPAEHVIDYEELSKRPPYYLVDVDVVVINRWKILVAVDRFSTHTSLALLQRENAATVLDVLEELQRSKGVFATYHH